MFLHLSALYVLSVCVFFVVCVCVLYMCVCTCVCLCVRVCESPEHFFFLFLVRSVMASCTDGRRCEKDRLEIVLESCIVWAAVKEEEECAVH